MPGRPDPNITSVPGSGTALLASEGGYQGAPWLAPNATEAGDAIRTSGDSTGVVGPLCSRSRRWLVRCLVRIDHDFQNQITQSRGCR